MLSWDQDCLTTELRGEHAQAGKGRERTSSSSDKQNGEISPELVLVSILPQSTGPDTIPESSSLSSHWEDTS